MIHAFVLVARVPTGVPVPAGWLFQFSAPSVHAALARSASTVRVPWVLVWYIRSVAPWSVQPSPIVGSGKYT